MLWKQTGIEMEGNQVDENDVPRPIGVSHSLKQTDFWDWEVSTRRELISLETTFRWFVGSRGAFLSSKHVQVV